MTHEACAHCGREAEFMVINKITGAGYVRCTNMDCRMETPVAKTEAEAWAIWDRRKAYARDYQKGDTLK